MPSLRILKLFLAFTLTASAGEKGTLKEFAAVRYDKDALVINSTAGSHQPLRYTGGSSNGERVAPDSEMRLPLDQVTKFLSSRHTVLIFTPLENVKGFKVSRICDFRSVRRGVSTEEFTITIETDGTLTLGEVTNIMIPGTAGK